MKRHEVVDRRRAHAGPLGRIHPVREVEDVEPAEEPLERQATELAPGHPDGVSDRERHELLVDVDRFERLPYPRRSAQPRRRERDDLVLSGRRREPVDHSQQIIPDPRSRQRERADVDDDSQRQPLGGTTSGCDPSSENHASPSRTRSTRISLSATSRGTRMRTRVDCPGETPWGSITRSSSTRSPASPVVYGPTVTAPVGYGYPRAIGQNARPSFVSLRLSSFSRGSELSSQWPSASIRPEKLSASVRISTPSGLRATTVLMSPRPARSRTTRAGASS